MDQEGNGMVKQKNSALKRQKSWHELRQVVRNMRRHFSSLSAKIPSALSFRCIENENGLKLTRIYFLGTLSGGRETTLLYADIPMHNPSTQEKKPAFSWQPLLESTFQVLHPLGQFSREEQLQWERKRLVMWGITAYDLHAEIGRFIFPACGSIFYCDDNNSQCKSPPYFPQELRSNVAGARLNHHMCPQNPDLVAYVYNSDLWLYHIKMLTEVRLTYARKGSSSLVSDPLSAGIPSYVIQEEFNRYNGYWWQPTRSSNEENVYRILYEEVDESDVEILHLPSYCDERDVEEFRFPRAGTSNAQSSLKMVQFSLSSSDQIENIVYLQLAQSLCYLSPNIEYIVRAGWTQDGKYVWTQVLDRQQCHLQLILIPLSYFVPPDHMVDVTNNHITSHPAMQVIYEETSKVWINVHDVLHFFQQEHEDELTFLWASEETGFRHLYLITVGLLMESFSDYIINSSFEKPESFSSNRILKKIALTEGEWEVSDKDIWVQEEKRLIFFIGLKDTPLERHLYVVSLDYPRNICCLTSHGFSHVVSMNKDCSLFVSIQSNINHGPFGEVYRLVQNGLKPVDLKTESLGYLLEPPSMSLSEFEYLQPELFSHSLKSGHTIYGMIFKPPFMQSNKKYPTVLTIYGGPEVQLVTNTYKGMRHLRQHLLAQEGYVVVAADCRGSRNRGINFESHIKGRMGTVEIADQVEVLLKLAETTNYIDLERVAIHGWSYGGYLSLMGLAQRPDIFKIAVAGAPVTSWNLYDTGYTERYMDTPTNNPEGYSNGSVLSYVGQLPNNENRLLIIHGLMDENVHFSHTSQLINAMVKAGKPYQLQVYPTERHSLRHLDASEHYDTKLLSFFQQYL